MQIFNSDESGITMVHKVVAEIGHSNVYSITSARTHTILSILSCASAFGAVLPPVMVYPRKC